MMLTGLLRSYYRPLVYPLVVSRLIVARVFLLFGVQTSTPALAIMTFN